MLCVNFGWNWTSGSGEEEKILKIVNELLLFCNYLPFEKGLDLHIKKLNSMLCARFGWKCPSGSEDFKKFSIMYYYYFAITLYLHFEKGVTLYLKKKTWIIFTQWCFVPSLVENGPVVLEKKTFKSFQCIFSISQLSPLWERRGPSFEQTWIPFTKGCSVPCLVEIGPMVLDKKTDGQTDGQTTDDRWSK